MTVVSSSSSMALPAAGAMKGTGSKTLYLLARCRHCGVTQALPRHGGNLVTCCEKQNNYDAWLAHAQQTDDWRPSAEVIGAKPENYEGLHLEWKQGTDGYWLMLGNKRLAEIAGRDVGQGKQSIAALNEFLASIPATPAKENPA